MNFMIIEFDYHKIFLEEKTKFKINFHKQDICKSKINFLNRNFELNIK